MPKLVSWIKIGVKKSETKLPSEGELLTEEEVQRLIEAADHPRDKAFISMLWESGGRISEIGNLLVKNLNFDKYGIKIILQGKTGSRKIRIMKSTPYISTWLNNHPFSKKPDASLWINVGTMKHHKPVGYSGLRMILQRTFIKAGIKKRFNPHSFRHSRATLLANHLTEFQMNQYFGWIQGSDMPSTYVHMSGKEVDKAILELNGVYNEKKKEQLNKPIICPRCETINAVNSNHCNKCGGILNEQHAIELEKIEEERKNADELMNLLLKDMDVQKFLKEKLQALKADGLSL